MNNEQFYLESRVIDWLRIPMAVLIVVLHTDALGVKSPLLLYSSLCTLLAGGICRIAVPMFFLFSGYFFFKGFSTFKKEMYFKKIRNRISSLLVPYIIWNLIALVFIYGYGFIRLRLAGEFDTTFFDPIRGWRILRIFGNYYGRYPIDYPLWFVRNLFLYCLASPLILFLIKRGSCIFILILGIVSVFWTHLPEGIFYFSLGGYFRLNNQSILGFSNRIKGPSYLLSVCLLFVVLLTFRSHPWLSQIVSRIFVFWGVFAAFSLASTVLYKKKISVHPLSAQCSFFIFASHGILILSDISHYICLHILPFQGELYYCLKLLLQPTIAICICFFLWRFILHFNPTFLDFLTGSRMNNGTYAQF